MSLKKTSGFAMAMTLGAGIYLASMPVPSSAAEKVAARIYPQTQAGNLFARWIDLCASPNLGEMTAWMEAHLSTDGAKRKPAASRAQGMYELCITHGGFDAQHVDAAGLQLTLVARGRKTHVWYALTYVFDEAGELDRMAADPVTPPEGALPKKLSDSVLAREIGQEAIRLSNAGLFSGVVVVARGTRPIAVTSAGFADRARKTPITADTQFTIGSIGKMLTAVAVGQLVDQKRLAFNDSVGHFLPDYPNAVVRDQVTIAMLLSHTAGLGDFLSERPPAMMKAGAADAEAYVPLFAHDELQFPPGSSWAYSNAGLALAGGIVERVSQENYFTYVQRHIFDAAGMRASDANNLPGAHDHLVTPYTQNSEEGDGADWQVAAADLGSPAGGEISTANDLVRFADALRNGNLVSKTTFDAMCTPNSLSPSEYRYGYAMEIASIYGQSFFGHSGGFAGVNAELHFLRGSPYTVVVLSNQDPPSASYLSSWAVALIAEKVKLERSTP